MDAMNKEKCLAIIREIFSTNEFVKHCGILIDEVECGRAWLHMPISDKVHTNLTGFVHGGALATLANTAIGVACCTVGAFSVTLNITTDFISNLRAGNTAWAEATVRHRGRRTIVVAAEVYDNDRQLLCRTMASMYVKGEDKRIPQKW